MPDLSGLTVDQAPSTTYSSALVVGKVTTEQPVDGRPDGVIIAQSPSGDSKVSQRDNN
ncbi:MAG: PASTA domain-containing protein [Veillonella sp.]